MTVKMEIGNDAAAGSSDLKLASKVDEKGDNDISMSFEEHRLCNITPLEGNDTGSETKSGSTSSSSSSSTSLFQIFQRRKLFGPPDLKRRKVDSESDTDKKLGLGEVFEIQTKSYTEVFDAFELEWCHFAIKEGEAYLKENQP